MIFDIVAAIFYQRETVDPVEQKEKSLVELVSFETDESDIICNLEVVLQNQVVCEGTGGFNFCDVAKCFHCLKHLDDFWGIYSGFLVLFLIFSIEKKTQFSIRVYISREAL